MHQPQGQHRQCRAAPLQAGWCIDARGSGGTDGRTAVRRDRRRGPLRGVADGDAAGPSGLRVLVVDRTTFPSDTVSTHVVHPQGVAALERWGLLDAVVAAAAARRSTPTRSTSARSPSTGSPGTRGLAGRLLPAAHGARHRARRRRRGGRRRGARGLRRRGDRHRGRRGRPASVAATRAAASVTERAHVVVGADGLQSLRRPRGATRAVQRASAAAVRLLHATGATCRSTAASRSTSATTAASRRRRRTTG